RARPGLAMAGLALVLVIAGSACQADVAVGVNTNADGSGRVQVSATLDREATAAAGQLALGDLRAAGWAVDGPRAEAGGGTVVTASKAFRTPSQATAIVAQLAGTSGPFKDFHIQRSHTLLTTRTRFSGTVDIRPCLGDFADDQLRKQLGANQCLGLDPQSVKQTTGVDLDRLVRFTVSARLPGKLTSSNAPTEAGNGAVWRPVFGEQVRLLADSRSYNVTTIVALLVAAVALLAFLAVVGVRLIGRKRAPSS
ncbi:MAG: hypothetical protein QOG64_103, partial [Acidimicrobiaceae bacterium]|nr:hypothetical protein [Acidimicrobiaceae bacterium]